MLCKAPVYELNPLLLEKYMPLEEVLHGKASDIFVKLQIGYQWLDKSTACVYCTPIMLLITYTSTSHLVLQLDLKIFPMSLLWSLQAKNEVSSCCYYPCPFFFYYPLFFELTHLAQCVGICGCVCPHVCVCVCMYCVRVYACACVYMHMHV